MVIPVQFESIEEIRAIQRLACAADEDVFLHSPDNAIMVDAVFYRPLHPWIFQAGECGRKSPYVIHPAHLPQGLTRAALLHR